MRPTGPMKSTFALSLGITTDTETKTVRDFGTGPKERHLPSAGVFIHWDLASPTP